MYEMMNSWMSLGVCPQDFMGVVGCSGQFQEIEIDGSLEKNDPQ